VIASDVNLEIYLDNAAATPVDPRVVELQASLMRRLVGNANNDVHLAGRSASAEIASAAAAVAGLIGGKEEDVLFCPSASIALALALEDAVGSLACSPCRVLASVTEHPALLHQLRQLAQSGRVALNLMPADRLGQIDANAFAAMISKGADLICAMAANNETGTVLDMVPILKAAAAVGALTLVDGAQAAGRVPVDDLVAQADYFIVSGAKLYGPRHAAALVSRFRGRIEGRSRHLLGSPDSAGAGALGLACRMRQAEMAVDEARIAKLRDNLEARLVREVPDLVVNGDRARRLAGFLNVSAPHVPGDAVVANLCGRVAISTGAACQTGVPAASHVLTAMGGPEWVADGAVRISLGKFTHVAEVEIAAELVGDALRGTRATRLVA
jgi:cysteine desulfurase